MPIRTVFINPVTYGVSSNHLQMPVLIQFVYVISLLKLEVQLYHTFCSYLQNRSRNLAHLLMYVPKLQNDCYLASNIKTVTVD